jgi:large subunit ribosomal protein L20
MAGLKMSGINVNRKALADLAVHDTVAFNQLLSVAKDSLGKTTAA